MLVSWFIRKGYQDFVHIISMDLYHPFLAYVLQFFSLISDSLDGVHINSSEEFGGREYSRFAFHVGHSNLRTTFAAT